MKRKIIVLISSLFLVVPFITPVYADTVTYWDGSIIGTNPVYNALDQSVSQGGVRYRFSYKPNVTTISYRASNGSLQYTAAFYIGEYSKQAAGTLDANYFKSQLNIYKDTVSSSQNVYTTNVYTDAGTVQYIQVGSNYRFFLVFSEHNNVGDNASTYTGNIDGFFTSTHGNSTNAPTIGWACVKQILGYDSPGSNYVLQINKANKETYLNVNLDMGFIRDGVITAFDDGNIIEPSGGTGSGSSGNDGDGYGNGIPSGSGTVGGSSITFDGSDNQVQNQSQYQSQSIESNAVNVTVNNEISGGSGGGSGESDVDRINALDNLLSNQSVGTSFNEAIQNVNNFRQLGVAFADTATVFLGWLPSWVLALLGLMFTLLFFFIILRLLKVFHG